jgi:RimJ/RimL family protein N-acetyltransferase
MKITLRQFSGSLSDKEFLFRTIVDSSIRPLMVPVTNAEIGDLLPAKEDYFAKLDVIARDSGHWLFMIEDRGLVIGEVNLNFGRESILFCKEPRTAWLGISIGSAAHRGCGVGKQALTLLFVIARERGVKQIEAGHFEFNEASARLLQSVGFEPLTIFPDFTYWNGKWWADVRMLKIL